MITQQAQGYGKACALIVCIVYNRKLTNGGKELKEIVKAANSDLGSETRSWEWRLLKFKLVQIRRQKYHITVTEEAFIWGDQNNYWEAAAAQMNEFTSSYGKTHSFRGSDRFNNAHNEVQYALVKVDKKITQDW